MSAANGKSWSRNPGGTGKRRSIFVKLVLIMLSISILTGAIFSGIFIDDKKEMMENHLIQENTRVAMTVAGSIEAGYAVHTLPLKTLHQINESADVLFWWIIEPDGRIYHASDPGMHGKKFKAQSIEEQTAVRDYEYEGKRIKLVIQPLDMGIGDAWALCIGISLKSVEMAVNKMIVTTLGFFSLIISLTCMLSFFLAKKITDPITQPADRTKAIADGDFDSRVEIKTGDELEMLGKTFNEMARQVKSSITQIREERDRSEFFKDLMGHDITNINQGISLYMELLLNSPDLPAEFKGYAKSASVQSMRIRELISNVRRLETIQKEELELKTLNVYPLFACAIDAVKTRYTEKEVEIRSESRDVIVRGNELLEQVFYNILDNAVKYSRHNPVVVEAAFREEMEYWRIEFKDNGPGVSDELKESIFKRFERGNRDKNVHGLGLGLTLVKQIVGECGGKVWVEDRVKGKHPEGSIFVLMLRKGD